jgi:DNA-binding MarR family transcriptional regulator
MLKSAKAHISLGAFSMRTAMMSDTLKTSQQEKSVDDTYNLENQIGFLLRRAHQRHVSIFTDHMPAGLTTQQFAVLRRLSEFGQLSQNELGRQAAMDQSTINGVVQRLFKRDLVLKKPSATDKRMVLLELTKEGRQVLEDVMNVASDITDITLKPLKPQQRATLLKLLHQIS